MAYHCAEGNRGEGEGEGVRLTAQLSVLPCWFLWISCPQLLNCLLPSTINISIIEQSPFALFFSKSHWTWYCFLLFYEESSSTKETSKLPRVSVFLSRKYWGRCLHSCPVASDMAFKGTRKQRELSTGSERNQTYRPLRGWKEIS